MNELLNWLFCVAWVLAILLSYHMGFRRGITIGEVRERLQWTLKMKKDKEGKQDG